MAGENAPSRSLNSRLQSMSLTIVLITVLLALGGTLWFTLRLEYINLDNNLMNSAAVIAQSPDVTDYLAGKGDKERVTSYLNNAIARVRDIDMIVLADRAGVVQYSPDSAYLGQLYPSSDGRAVLEGTESELSTGTGISGIERTAFAAVRSSDGTILGFAAVGIRMRSVHKLVMFTVLCFALLATTAIILSSLLARHISKGIKRALMGYEPDAFRRLFNQREDILDALEEGILAIDTNSNIIYLNQAAARMMALSSPHEALNRPLQQIYPASKLSRLLHTKKPEYNVSIQYLPGVNALSDRMPIWQDGQVIGAVGIFRDRTEMTRLAEDLTGVRHMVEAMRAYTHGFMNKLHIIFGLLQLGKVDQAQDYIMEITQTQRQAVSRVMSQIADTSLAALLVGKTSRAAELDIHLTVDRKSQVSDTDHFLPSGALITILGNLIDNSMDSLNNSPRKPKEITVSVREDTDTLVLCVEDNGPGIPPQVLPHIFESGFSTKGDDRGTGLSRVKEITALYHGRLRVESQPWVGTSFFISFQADPDEPLSVSKEK